MILKKLIVFSILGIVILATGLIINRPTSSRLEATEIVGSDRVFSEGISEPFLTEGNVSVILKNSSVSRSFGVELAETVEEQSVGLADRDQLSSGKGMLFVFDPPAQPSFWMRGMRFNLDMVWIADGKIIQIDRNLPVPKIDSIQNLPTYQPPQPIDYVLEIVAGQAVGFSIGDQATVITSEVN